jgi:hypothetical protein
MARAIIGAVILRVPDSAGAAAPAGTDGMVGVPVPAAAAAPMVVVHVSLPVAVHM